MTLIEMVIVIAILALSAGFIGINLNKALREQRFRSEMALVASQLGLAQDLMLILDVDASVNFATEEKGIRVWIETEAPLSPEWMREIARSSAYLTVIENISYQVNDGLKQEKAEEGILQVYFRSTGSSMTDAIIRLSTADRDERLGALTRYICIPGYPKAIRVTTSAYADPACDSAKREEQKLQLTQEMITEVQRLTGSVSR